MILEVDAVDTYYGETQALFGASLAVKRATVFALLGPNGAGKTTMQPDPRDRTFRHRLGARRSAAVSDADGSAQSRHRTKTHTLSQLDHQGDLRNIFAPAIPDGARMRKPVGR